METSIIAQSGTITLPLNEVLSLKKGDIIPLHYDPNSPLKVLVENNLKFFATPGIYAGKRAISLTGVYQ
jgi:flagellar motor switch protein FliM